MERTGSAVALNRRGAVHRGSCAGELLAVAGGHGGVRGHVWGARGVGLGRGERIEMAGKGQSIACVSSVIGALQAGGTRVKGGSRREKEEGARGVACCGRRGTSSGALGRPEVAGGAWQGAATVRERTVARSRACLWLPWHSLRGRGVSLMSGNAREK